MTLCNAKFINVCKVALGSGNDNVRVSIYESIGYFHLS